MKTLITIIIILSIAACESFVEIGPPKTESISVTVYADDLTATSAIRGIYHEMSRTGFASGQTSSVTVCAGASADEFKTYNPSLDEFLNNAISPSNGTVSNTFWTPIYKYVYYCNSAVEGITLSTGLSSPVRNQLLGEAKFLRAFCYFYLTEVFGDVPLILSTDYKKNAVMSRNTRQNVFDQIKLDLMDAQSLLATDYRYSNSERVRVNSFAATALLARVYLYNGEWDKAEAQSTVIINNVALYKLLSDLNGVFLKNSTESIWQLMQTVPTLNTNEAVVFNPASATSFPSSVSMSDNLVNSFEGGDKRKLNWVGTQTVSGTTFYYPFKYKVFKTGQALTEYSIVLRVAEQFLIRAEARTKQNKFTEAMQDIDVIRSRAGLASITTKIASPSMDNLLLAIEQERRIEFFSEWAHRWFDLNRTGRATAVLSPLKPGWSPTDALYPLPQVELVNNANLNPQNPGY